MTTTNTKDIKFSRLSGATPAYGVTVNGVSLGYIEATTPSRYPGRSKASYTAFPALSDGSAAWRTGLGTLKSREAAALRIVAYLKKFKYGRELVEKANGHRIQT